MNSKITNIKLKNEMKIAEKYFKLCNEGILLNNKNFKKNINPKLSIISPIHNKEKYILRFLRSIQNQFFDNIEIILIDDGSSDNSLKIIKQLQKKDERIILLKHSYVKGTLISRNEGVIMSKGEYLIFMDPDDLSLNDILKKSYQMLKTNHYEILRFNVYIGNYALCLNKIVKKLKNKVIYQPDLSLYIFYGLEKLNQNDYFLWNKVIKRETFILALNSINKYYYNQFMIDCEDGLINFMLYKIAKSYYFFKKIGYYYILNSESIAINSREKLQKRLKSNFLYFKFIFQNTKNNKIEKKIAEYIFLSIYKNYKYFIFDFIKNITQSNELFNEVTDLYLNCKYISEKAKKIFIKIKYMINKRIF